MGGYLHVFVKKNWRDVSHGLACRKQAADNARVLYQLFLRGIAQHEDPNAPPRITITRLIIPNFLRP